MKDRRLNTFRSTLDGLVESLEALVRVARWGDAEVPPEPLSTAVTELGARLAAADRLSSGTFVGSELDKQQVSAMCDTMKQLDLAYVAYQQRIDKAPEQRSTAVAALEADIAAATGAR